MTRSGTRHSFAWVALALGLVGAPATLALESLQAPAGRPDSRGVRAVSPGDIQLRMPAAGMQRPPATPALVCLTAPPPEDPDSRVGLCSPSPNEVQVRILPEGVELSWDAPPRATTAYVGPIQAVRWIGVDSAAVVATAELHGAYLAVRDRRIELTVSNVDSLGVPIARGVIGRERVRVGWTNVWPVEGEGVVAGSFDLPPGYSGQLLRFDVPNRDPQIPPDTTALAGLRVSFRNGDEVRIQDSAVFDVEDFEGWHVWRWGEDPTSLDYLALGEYSKLHDYPQPVWPDGIRLVFTDRAVFDGFIYHYTITTYDQGFKRDQGGQDLGVKFDSPIAPATRNPDGSVTLAPTQIRVHYRKEPPTTFEPIAAVPNPFREAEADPSRPETQVVYFINAPPRGTLYIWTVAGDLVLQRDHEQPTVGTILWDTTNQSGEKVASGVYIFKIVDLVSGRASYGRLAIIR